MKNDQQKVDPTSFYWDGLEAVTWPHAKDVIQCYQQVVKNPCIETIKLLWEIATMDEVDEQNIIQLMYVYQHGAQKYGDKNYLGLELERIISALGRHIIAWASNVTADQDSGYRHFSHILANILILAELITQEVNPLRMVAG